MPQPNQCARCGVYAPGPDHAKKCAPTQAMIRLEKRVELLEDTLRKSADALDEAADDIAGWGAYASDYFQEKHNLKKDVEDTKIKAFGIRAVLALKP